MDLMDVTTDWGPEMSISAELEMDPQHGPIVRVIVDGTKHALNLVAMRNGDAADVLRAEIEQLRKGKELLAKQLAYYRRDNERLNNALAWEHNESDNAKDASRYRWLRDEANSNDLDYYLSSTDRRAWDADIDEAREGE